MGFPSKSRSRRKARSGSKQSLWLLIIALTTITGWLWWAQRHPAEQLIQKTPDVSTTGERHVSVPTNTAITQQTSGIPSVRPSADFSVVRDNPATNTHSAVTEVSPPALLPALEERKQLDLVERFTTGDRPPRSPLEIQIALTRWAISPGSLDGVIGSQTRTALRVFQQHRQLPVTGEADPVTRAALALREPVFTTFHIAGADLARLAPMPDTWLEKSQRSSLPFESALELAAERGWSHPGLIRALNPGLNWTNISPGTAVKIPSVEYPPPRQKAASIRIQLSARTLQAFDSNGRLLAHFPCSIARHAAKRPVGRLTVEKIAENPNYRFDPSVFPESAEARRLNRPLMIPPGPNNPVGTAWIGLDRPGYGIHGTPHPEAVGRTESHGCFRLANWNASHLLQLVRIGTPVDVEP